MGCVRQWQWCNPSLPKDQACGPLASYTDSYLAAAPLFGITDEEMEGFRESTRSPGGSALIWGHLIANHNPFTLYQFLGAARTNFLASEDRLYGAVAAGLPDDQWKLDVARWWESILATRQLSYINTVRGPSEPEFEAMRLSTVNNYEKTFYESQASVLAELVLSAAHTSFSMFGLCFTFATGGLIVLISYLLDPMCSFLHTRFRHKSYQHLEWRSNATLQIHRQAEEQIGSSTWKNCTSVVPTSAMDDVLSSLDITDPRYPKLRRPASTVSGLPLDDLYEGSEEQQNADDCTLSNTAKFAKVDISTVFTGDAVVEGPGQGSPPGHPGNEPKLYASPFEFSPLNPRQARTSR
ncbi:hypothetical protein PG994_002557 [Apiospora phragmitis]|uniref:Uncharacterized protein n=1 Tax=Apiospora phragmitis TaxID=2905665 RepID=A0ABR1W5J3_9PEZI